MAIVESGRVGMSGYRLGILRRAQADLTRFYGADRMKTLSMGQIAKDQGAIRAYKGLDGLDMSAVSDRLVRLTAQSVTVEQLRTAEAVKLSGGEMVEDAAAGEATRLGLGTKYLLTPERLVKALMDRNMSDPKNIIPIPISPNDIAPISFGTRHKLQLVYDMMNLAASPAYSVARNPEDVLKDQASLTILNEETAETIIREIIRFGHLGLSPERTLFMIQEKTSGMGIREGQLYFDPKSEFRLWNHMDMKAQQTLQKKVFWVRFNESTGDIEKIFLTPDEVEAIFASKQNLVSLPIEDIDFLTGSIYLRNLAVALDLGNQGFNMTMEGVAQGVPPQKGGFFAFDPSDGQVHCYETDGAGGIINEKDPQSLARIKWLNKNFNNFPNPVAAFRAAAKLFSDDSMIPVHLTEKSGSLYPQAPQGDLNFELRTAYIGWDPVQPIRNLKVLENGPATLLAMAKQDKQPGFLDLARRFGVI